MEVILLGTGGPRPDPRRMATTTLIRLGGENILFDAGPVSYTHLTLPTNREV